MIKYRVEPLDYKVVFENIVSGLNSYAESNGIKCYVIGLSGGLDSTVVSALCKASNVPLIGVSLPCSTNKSDEVSSASLAGSEFCTEFNEINLQEPFEVMEKFCTKSSGLDSTAISQGNIKARLRMITLYDIASKRRGIVMGTSNLSEWWEGFWTIHGDSGDLNPIGELWKTEVYELAKWMKENVYKDSKALEAAINIVPTDGNGVSKSDMEQIMPGYTYAEIDHVLSKWEALNPKIRPMYASDGLTESIKNTIFDVEDEDVKKRRMEECKKHNKEFVPNLGDLYGVDSVRKVIMRSWNSEYKRRTFEVCLSIKNGEVITH